jgi:hypothetical protein
MEIDIRFLVLVKFEKQTDGTRRRKLRANPDVESKFSKNNYAFNITHVTYESAVGEFRVKLDYLVVSTSRAELATTLGTSPDACGELLSDEPPAMRCWKQPRQPSALGRLIVVRLSNC